MILVTGGTGFIGSYVVARLAASGARLRVVSRGEQKLELPKTVEHVRADVVSGEGLEEAMAGVDKVAHLVAIIVEKGKQKFDPVIRGGTENVVKAAKEANVKKMVYVSAIGAAPDPQFPYWHAKWQAERSIINSGLNYAIIRPSLAFGPEDEFFNRLAGLVRRLPVVPVAGSGKTRFQPIWVEDVATCIIMCLEEGRHDGRIVEIGGPEQYSYDELLDIVSEALGKKRRRVHLPLWYMGIVARALQRVLSKPPVTTNQLAMLAKDNVAALDSVQSQFGFQPRRLPDALSYLRNS